MENNNEVLKILSMIESGKITAEEGASLLSALKDINASGDNAANTTRRPRIINFSNMGKSAFEIDDDSDLGEAIRQSIDEYIDSENFDSIADSKIIIDNINKKMKNKFGKLGKKAKAINKFVFDSSYFDDQDDNIKNDAGSEDSDDDINCDSESKSINNGGRATIKSGQYDKINIIGVSTIEKNVTIDKLSIVGACKAGDGLTADTLNVDGKFIAEGSITVDSCKVSGSMECNADMTCDELSVSGKFVSNSTVTCDNLALSGAGEFISITCDNATVKGSIVVKEQLTADKVYLRGKFDIKEMTADKIRIERDLSSKIFNSKCYIGVIDCEEITADYLDCDELNCVKATLSDNCNVKKINYKE